MPFPTAEPGGWCWPEFPAQHVGPDQATAGAPPRGWQTLSIPFCKEKITESFSSPSEHPVAQLLGPAMPSWDLRSCRPGGSRLPLSHQTTNVTSMSQFFVTDGYRDGEASATGAGFSTTAAASSAETCRDGRGVRCSVGTAMGCDAPWGVMLHGATEGGARCRRLGCPQTFRLRVGSYFASG